MKSIHRVAIPVGAALLALWFNTAVAQAAPAPPGYRSDEILRSVTTAVDGIVPIRRGWYDTATQNGFGLNKACQRHNICSLDAITFVLESPIASPKGNEPGFNYTAYAQETINDTVTNEVKVIAADNPGNFPLYFGSPAGNPLGLQTIYCETVPMGEAVLDLRCPDWDAGALARQGTGGTENFGGSATPLMKMTYSRSYQPRPIMSVPAPVSVPARIPS